MVKQSFICDKLFPSGTTPGFPPGSAGPVPGEAGNSIVAGGAAVSHDHQPLPRQQRHRSDGC